MRKPHKFNQNWLLSRSWLRYDPICVLMWCEASDSCTDRSSKKEELFYVRTVVDARMVTMQLDHTFLDLLGDTLQSAASFWNNTPSRLKTLQAVAHSLEVSALKLGVLHTHQWSAFAGDALRRLRSGCTLKETMAPMSDAVACRGVDRGTRGSGSQKGRERK